MEIKPTPWGIFRHNLIRGFDEYQRKHPIPIVPPLPDDVRTIDINDVLSLVYRVNFVGRYNHDKSWRANTSFYMYGDNSYVFFMTMFDNSPSALDYVEPIVSYVPIKGKVLGFNLLDIWNKGVQTNPNDAYTRYTEMYIGNGATVSIKILSSSNFDSFRIASYEYITPPTNVTTTPSVPRDYVNTNDYLQGVTHISNNYYFGGWYDRIVMQIWGSQY